MKIYTLTENQVKEIYVEGWSEGQNHTNNVEKMDKFINSINPIELPSDDEIEKSYPYCFQFTDDHYFGNKDCFKEGAKWMKNQILNQNK